MCQYVKPPINLLRQKVANDGGDHFVTYKNIESLCCCTPETNIISQLYFQKMGGRDEIKKKKKSWQIMALGPNPAHYLFL